MKTLILVLFAIVTFSFGINAQDLSFNTFNQTIEPKGELVSTVNFYGKLFYNYHEWNKYGITVTKFLYSPDNKKVESVTKQSIFFDELDFDKMTFGESNAEKFVVIFQTKGRKSSSLKVDYEADKYTKSPYDDITFTLKTKADAEELIKNLKEKAFDMSLDLDAQIERVNLKNELRYFTAEYPNGIGYDDYRTATQRKPAGETKIEDDEEETTTTTNTNSSNNSASNNSTPKEKTEISLKLWNKSNGEIDISYESRGAGGGKTQTSINGRSTKSVKMKVGGRVFEANGAVLLTVTAAMEDTEQVIFK